MYDHMKDYREFQAEVNAERVSRFGELPTFADESGEHHAEDFDFLVLDNSFFEGE